MAFEDLTDEQQYTAIERLISGIIQQASYDYMKALCKDDYRRLHETRSFFMSDMFLTMTHNKINPEWLMRQLQKKCEEHEYDWNKLKYSCYTRIV